MDDQAIEIRLAGVQDLDSIMRLETQAFPRGWSARSWAEEIHDHYVAVGYSNHGMGVIAMSTVAGTAELHRIIVAPQAQGHGLGRALVSHGLEWSARFGSTQVFLEVSAGNQAAIGLYESCGFTLLDRRADYYEPGDDALVYRRVIPPTDPVILAQFDSESVNQLSATPEEESCPNR